MKKDSTPIRFTHLLALLGATLLFATVPVHAAETLTSYHFDALGSPVAATDYQGKVVWREEYKPYGERIKNEAAAQANTRWYTGHPHDNTTGLTYTGARYYDPAVGRFMGVDPKGVSQGNPHSFNRYAYGNNNPYKYIDPNGEDAVRVNLGLIGFTVGIDTASGQPFLQFRAGAVGGGVEYYTSYNFFDSNTRMVGDCKACDAGAQSSGMNISAGGSLKIGPVGIEGKLFERFEKFANVEHSDGSISSHGIRSSDTLKADVKLGWSKPDIAPRNHPYVGANVDLEANAEWGWLVPWSSTGINPNVQSQRDPNF